MNLSPTIFDLGRLERAMLAIDRKLDRLLAKVQYLVDECRSYEDDDEDA